jgi:hypothetical protein
MEGCPGKIFMGFKGERYNRLFENVLSALNIFYQIV